MELTPSSRIIPPAVTKLIPATPIVTTTLEQAATSNKTSNKNNPRLKTGHKVAAKVKNKGTKKTKVKGGGAEKKKLPPPQRKRSKKTSSS